MTIVESGEGQPAQGYPAPTGNAAAANTVAASVAAPHTTADNNMNNSNILDNDGRAFPFDPQQLRLHVSCATSRLTTAGVQLYAVCAFHSIAACDQTLAARLKAVGRQREVRYSHFVWLAAQLKQHGASVGKLPGKKWSVGHSFSFPPLVQLSADLSSNVAGVRPRNNVNNIPHT
jgi:hypothetical protein